MEKRSLSPARAALWVGAVLLALLLLIARRPVAVAPADVYSVDCTLTADTLWLQPRGPYNPGRLKEWKVTARYEPGNESLYVTCWLKPGLVFDSFGSMGVPIAGYGKIRRVVLAGGWGAAEKVVWEAG